MQNRPKEFDLSLLQRDPGREARLDKMRSKLAGFAPPAVPVPKPRVAKGSKSRSWAIRIGLLGAVIACNYLAFDRKDALLATVAPKAVPSLAEPSASLSNDEQALYWTYALYDLGRFKRTFHVTGYPAIDRAVAVKHIEELLPVVTPATLGVISGYMPIAFHSVSSGGAR